MRKIIDINMKNKKKKRYLSYFITKIIIKTPNSINLFNLYLF